MIRPLESPVRFGRDGHLIGIATHPATTNDRPVVVFLNSGIVHSIGANRIYVRLARALTAEGFPTFRFDLSGIGDSRAAPEGAHVPRREVVTADISDATAEAYRLTGARESVLIGLCSGADDALDNVDGDESRLGAIAIDPDIIRTPRFFIQEMSQSLRAPHVAQRAMRRALKASARLQSPARPAGGTGMRASTALSRVEMRERLRTHVRSGKRELFLFTAGLPQRYNYPEQFRDAFRGIDYAAFVEHLYFRDADHTFSTEEMRQALVHHVVDWCRRSFPTEGPRASLQMTG